MRVEDWKLIGWIATILGIIFLVGAAITYAYSETILFGLVVTYPYRGNSAGLLINGIVLLVVGIGCLWRAEGEKKRTSPSPPASPPQQQ
jgi:formate hydrogenlyase subunit 3/multisubunit Na+/H+ antiporter MnhD subunit